MTDPRKRQYRDEESIMDGAVDNFASITLGNGGAYQKKYVNVNLEEVNKDDRTTWPEGYNPENDLYQIKG